jgi:membrane-bound metal-dependent hydrolase YbcI (DUF457 family)
MDIQPLLVMISGKGHLHGFTHTFIGAAMIAVFAGLSGKTLSGFILRRAINSVKPIAMGWKVVFISALIGSVSHVLLDSIMHMDVELFYPFSAANTLLGLMPIDALHLFCLFSGLVGSFLYIGIMQVKNKCK